MTQHAFITADVFTDRPFGGNPLAVFPEAAVPPELMQRLAAELHLSETVFVLPPENPAHTRRLRIFTPGMELPFAGHPTVGTAIILAETGQLGPIDRRLDIVFEEGAGPVPVTIERGADGRLTATLTSSRVPSRVPGSLDPTLLAAAIGLKEAMLQADVAPAIYSAGVSFAIIPVRPEFLSQAHVDLALWRSDLAQTPAQHLYLAALDDWAGGHEARVRMFAPAMGITEDPATGAAAAAFVGFLADRQKPADGAVRWTLSQGTELGRPSRIEIGADLVDGKLTAARVGGTAVLMSRGAFDL